MFYGSNTTSKTEIFRKKKPHKRDENVAGNMLQTINCFVCVECEICVVSGAATLVCNVYHENLISSAGDGFLLAPPKPPPPLADC